MPCPRRTSTLLTTALSLTMSFALTLPCAAEQQWRSSSADHQKLALTIYQNDQALVRDRRQLALPTGVRRLIIDDVSHALRPETVQLRGENKGRRLRVLEQNLDYDLLTPARLLERSVGSKVRVVRENGREEEALVLAARDGLVLQFGERIETGVPGRLVFSALPTELRASPTLSVTVDNPLAEPQTIELTYLSGGLDWHADYVAQLSGDGRHLDLDGWASVSNRSGIGYRNVHLQLVAGSPQRVAGVSDRAPRVMMAAMEKGGALPEESVGGYHLYTLPRATDLEQNQTKQLSLLSAGIDGVRNRLLLRGQDHYYAASSPELPETTHIESWLEFDNHASNGAGLPLPGGVVRVYRQTQDGTPQFVGEDRIDHVATGSTVRLRLGDEFDVNAKRVQTDFRKPAAPAHAPLFESAYRIVLHNARSEGVTVRIEEPIPGSWDMITTTHPVRKEAANLAVWEIAVAGRGETTLEYRVRVRY